MGMPLESMKEGSRLVRALAIENRFNLLFCEVKGSSLELIRSIW